MEIAIVGGTGELGAGLAMRLGADTEHTIVIGSREADRATTRAEAYSDRLNGRKITGVENERAVTTADIVVLAVPPYHIAETAERLSPAFPAETVVVSPAVGMRSDESGVHAHQPGAGSVTAVVREAVPASYPVVGACHTLPGARLVRLEASLGIDTVVVGDDSAAKETVQNCLNEIDGLRALDGGGLAMAAELEAVAPLLITLGRHTATPSEVGIRFQ